jgi:TonB family protein
MNWSDALSEPARPLGLDPGDDAHPIAPPLFASTGLHLFVLGVLIALSIRNAPSRPAEEKPPVTVELQEPRARPEPPPALRSQPPSPKRALPVPPRENLPLRMQPAPDPGSKSPSTSKPPLAPPDGRAQTDGRAAGGRMGGPLPNPTPGFPDEESRGERDPNESIESRLRNFRSAVQKLGVPSAGGPKGGGTGSGGLDMPDLPPTGFGFGNLQFEGNDYDWTPYGRAIYWPILRAWYARLYLTAGSFEKWAASVRSTMLDHQVQVRFTIQASGEVTDIMIEGPSGCQPLDQSATDALRAVILPKLPADFSRASETVHARFIMEGDTRWVASSLEPYIRAWGL